nr:phage tail protein [uncultured Mucilaginibacter sp.]
MENKEPQALAEPIMVASINLLPVGTIMPFAGNADTAKELNTYGWFLCDGAELPQKDYPRLFTILEDTCKKEPGRFFLPDLRGTFLRGVDVPGHRQERSRDPDAGTRKSHILDTVVGNQVLSRQADAFISHGHDTPKGTRYNETLKIMKGDAVTFDKFYKPVNPDTMTTAATGGKETRPVNVSVNYIIFAGINNSLL